MPVMQKYLAGHRNQSNENYYPSGDAQIVGYNRSVYQHKWNLFIKQTCGYEGIKSAQRKKVK
jgi:hypothetical protein